MDDQLFDAFVNFLRDFEFANQREGRFNFLMACYNPAERDPFNPCGDKATARDFAVCFMEEIRGMKAGGSPRMHRALGVLVEGYMADPQLVADLRRRYDAVDWNQTPDEMADDDLREGVRIGKYDAEYELVRRLGAGGNGEVWQATQYAYGEPIKTVAIKILHRDVSQDDERVARFQNEVVTAAKLDHPHIVPYINHGTWKRGRPYLALAFKDGGTLRDQLNSGPVEPSQVLGWLSQIADALWYAHQEAGIIHRDIKPENILLSADQKTVYLTDFGLAKNLNSEKELSTGKTVKGTGRYMSPEQWKNATLSHQTDVYGLAHLAYELLTGERAFHKYEDPNADFDLAKAHVEFDLPRHHLIRPMLWHILLRATRQNPAERYQRATEFVADLTAWQHKLSEVAPEVMVAGAERDAHLIQYIGDAVARAGYQPTRDPDHFRSMDDGALTRLVKRMITVVVIASQYTTGDETVERLVRIARDTKTPVMGVQLDPLDNRPLLEASWLDARHLDRDTLTNRLRENLTPLAPPEPDKVTADRTARTTTTPNAKAQLSPEVAYLRSWFDKPWCTVSLAEFGGAEGHVSLLDVYVPLRVDLNVAYTVKDGKIVDWWVQMSEDREHAETMREQLGDMEAPEPRKVRTWDSLDVGEDAIQRALDVFEEKIKARGGLDEDRDSSVFMETQDAASLQPRFVLVGDPGSGKSSFVRYMTLCHAGALLRKLGANDDIPENASLEAMEDWLLGAFTPIYIELRDLVARVFPLLPEDDAGTPLPGVAYFWRYVERHLLVGMPPGTDTYLRSQLASGEALLLLDGLDEVDRAVDDRRRQQIQALVDELSKTYPQARMIVTSRPVAYKQGGWALKGFGRSELVDLELGRLHQLAQQLFQHVEPSGTYSEQSKAVFTALASSHHMQFPNKSHLLNFLQEHH